MASAASAAPAAAATKKKKKPPPPPALNQTQPQPLKFMDPQNLALWGEVEEETARARWQRDDDDGVEGAGGGAVAAAVPAAAASLPTPSQLASCFAWFSAAAASGDVEHLQRVHTVLQQGGAASAEAMARALSQAGGPDGLAPLAAAAKRGDLSMLRALAALGAPVDEASDLSGLNPLAATMMAGQLEAARFLLDEQHADPNARLGAAFAPAPGGTALHAAVVAVGDRDDLAKSKGRQREAAIDAVLEEVLSRAGARVDVDARDDRGATALMLAAYHGRMGAMKLLVNKAHANANLRDREGQPALTHLLRAWSNRTWDPLARSYSPPFIDVPEAARLLVSVAGARVNVRVDAFGMTPLFHAARHGRVKTLRILLAAPGAKEALAARSRLDGRTAVHHAIVHFGDDEEYVTGENTTTPLRLLLRAGADPNVPDAEGRVAAFRVLSSSWRLPALRALLDDANPPADPSATAPDGTTLLMKAIESGNTEAALLLVERGADTRAVKRWWGRQGSAADLVLAFMTGERSLSYYVSTTLFDKVLGALLRKGAPFDRERYGSVVMARMPELLRQPDDPAPRRELARLRSVRQRTLGQEDVVGLAFDFLDLRAAEEGVRRREERVAELEKELGIESGDDEGDEGGDEKDRGGHCGQKVEDEDAPMEEA